MLAVLNLQRESRTIIQVKPTRYRHPQCPLKKVEFVKIVSLSELVCWKLGENVSKSDDVILV